VTWEELALTSLTACFVSMAVVGGFFAYLLPRLMQRLPSSRLAKLETEMSEVLQSFDGLMATWKKFRNAEGMRELRAARLHARTSSSPEPAATELKGAAWKEQARKNLGVALHNPKAIGQLHERNESRSESSGTGATGN